MGREFLPPILCARRREFAVCADDDSSARRCCGIVCRFPQKAKSPSESARLANGKYHRPFEVVSKCALRDLVTSPARSFVTVCQSPE